MVSLRGVGSRYKIEMNDENDQRGEDALWVGFSSSSNEIEYIYLR